MQVQPASGKRRRTRVDLLRAAFMDSTLTTLFPVKTHGAR